MTTNELYEIIAKQQIEIDILKKDYENLKEWSDLNDYWLREMIDALTESVDKLMGIEDNYDENDNYISIQKEEL